MSAAKNISLKLSFNQVLEAVRQLPEGQQEKLVSLINKDAARQGGKKFSGKEKKFLEGIDESVEFINNYEPGKGENVTLKQFLNEL